ncbi:MAG: hypothetical protein MUF19_04255 [Candidatus Pacebacteria bacterium]|jgi:chromosome segregation ATPase|nr:hypothetical protein [Candidatus Paceibacterota bacterium]
MAFDDVQAKQRLLDDALSKQRRQNDELNRLRLDQQSKMTQLTSHYKGEVERVQKDANTLQANINLIQKDIITLQKKQSELQQKLRELQDEQTGRQTKLTEQQKRHTDLSTKVSGIMRDQEQATRRLTSDYERKIAEAERALEQTMRAIGTLQADVTRAVEKQQRASVAKTNSAPGTAGRQINGLRRF